ncbi:hypothetical protein GCM10028771_33980 [Nocardioides marmoraquaticus]
MKTRLDVAMAPRRAATWEERHLAGEVPGRWPYGLDHLAGSSSELDVRLRLLPEPGRAGRFLARLPRARVGRKRIGLAWDENVAQRLVACRDYDVMHCGVIWATDRWMRDKDALSRTARLTLAAMTSVWTLSRPQLDALDGLLPVGVRRTFVKFGVDPDFYSYRPYPDRPMVFSVGGDRDRDTATLLEAYRIVAEARPRTRLLLQTKRECPVPEGVEVVPHLSHLELRRMYAEASVVAVATRPNLHVSGMTVSLEAQATGRPVVLTATPGTEDYVTDGSTGHLTPVGDGAALAERIIHLLDDPDAAAQQGLAGRAAVEATFTDVHLARRLLEATSA